MSEPLPVFVCLFSKDLTLAEPAAQVFGGRVDLRGRDFNEVSAHLGALFLARHPIVGFCASAILIRALAPYLTDKTAEPPILSVASDGTTVVPLLGGHHGANALARRLADYLQGSAAVTTAGDVQLGVALDEPPKGWRLVNPEAAKTAMAGLLNGAGARLSGTADWLRPLHSLPNVDVSAAPENAPEVLSVEGAEPLIWRRTSYALGVGCARGCAPEELNALVQQTLAGAGIAPEEIASVHSLDLKADEAAVHTLAKALAVPAGFFSARTLDAERGRLASPSEAVFAEVGCFGVAEGAALAAAGPDGELVVPKQKSTHATCALARLGGSPTNGASRGSLAVIGIGPGVASWRTPEASELIAAADELVGYRLYLDLLGPTANGKAHKVFSLGEEEARCRYALEAAGKGRRVALICSGDGGIYAMGALVMELLDRPEHAGGVSQAAHRVEIVHVPGISALQAASARTGAVLGHDFCAISLSDLLTPADTIRRRLKAAAEGDFVIAFYNPVSRRRRRLLAEARDLLLQHRPPDTPIILAAHLGRPAERLDLRRLDRLEVDEVDMLTTVIVGSSASRIVESGDASAGISGRWVYTPRGYAKKLEQVLP